MDYRQLAYQTAQRYGIDPDMFARLIQQESSWRPDVVSPAGAIGLGQLMPETAAELGVTDPYDPAQNLDGAARYFAQQLRNFGTPELALAAYNAGPGAVERYGGIPPFEETQNYVRIITGGTGAEPMNEYAQYDTQQAPQGAPQIAPGMEPMAVGAQDWSMDMLTRPQRMMLGFAALRDAGAALQGQSSNYFADTLSGITGRYQTQRELEFRRGQEARLRNEQLQATRMNALQGLAQLDAQEAQARQMAAYNGVTYVTPPAVSSMREALQRQLASTGMQFGAQPPQAPAGAPAVAPTVTPTQQPVVPPTVAPQQAAEQPAPAPQRAAGQAAMTGPMATQIINNPTATSAQIREALQFLQNLPPQVAGQVPGYANLVERGISALEDAVTRETEERSQAEQRQQTADLFQSRGNIIADYLFANRDPAQRFDQNGDPILSAAAQPLGRLGTGLASMAGVGSAQYEQYAGALQQLKETLTFETLSQYREAGALPGALTDADMRAISRLASTMDVNNPLGTIQTLRQIEREYGLDFGISGGRAQSGFNAGGLTFTPID